MARLQILELPEGSGDDRPPFVLVIDQADDATADDITRWPSNMAERIGARHVLVFEDTVDIPSNDITAYREQVAEELHYTQGIVTREPDGIRLAHERTDIARDMDRLAKRRDELADALGVDRGSSWDVTCNAARVLRRMCDDQAAAIERVRQESARIRATTRTWEPVADRIDAALSDKQEQS